MTTNYPKTIPFESPLTGNHSLLPAWRDRLVSVLGKTTFTLLDEHTLQLDYPEDEVRQVRLVNIDDSLLRMDFVLADDPQALHRVSLFPKTGWDRHNFFAEHPFANCTREILPGKTIFKFESK